MLKSGCAIVFVLASSRMVFAEPGWIEGVTVQATSAQVPRLFGPENLTTMSGLKETVAGSGKYQLTINSYADGGNCWQTGYGPHGPDELPTVEFDLQAVYRLTRMHIWNHNGSPQRGIRSALVLVSTDGKQWGSRRERLELSIAPKKDDYLGEEVPLDPPLTGRFVRFRCLATHREGGQPDLAGMGKVRFQGERVSERDFTSGAEPPLAARHDVPFDAGWIDLSRPPYSAPGDGITDATNAIQRAIDDWQGSRRVLLLPKGVYRITRSLKYQPGKGHGYNTLFGAGRDATTLRLDDGVWPEPGTAQAVVDFGFNGQADGSGVHADWFNNNIADLTIDTGRGNRGAIGLRYYSNNVGSARRVVIRSGDGSGRIGLDLGYADQNGPCLASEIDIDGFAIGVRTGATVNSQTLEAVRVRRASSVGFENSGQCLALRKMDVESNGPGFVSKFGVVALIDSTFRHIGPAPNEAAVVSHEALFARTVQTSGYKVAIVNRRADDAPGDSGPTVDEFVSHPVLAPAGGAKQSLRLPIEETPDPEPSPLKEWANVLHFRAVTDSDDSTAFQRAVESRASTLYWPSGVSLRLGAPVVLPDSVHRVVGFFSEIQAMGPDRIGFVVDGSSSRPLVIEQITGHVGVRIPGSRKVVVRDTQGVEGVVSGTADVFLDNVVGEWEFGPGRAWCRQFNTERQGVHAVNRGGALWILGLKTERGGTLVESLPGARTEVIGGLSYTTTAGGLAPMFTARNAALSVTLGEVCYTGDPFKTLVEQSLGETAVVLNRGDAPLRPAFLQGSSIPLYIGRP